MAKGGTNLEAILHDCSGRLTRHCSVLGPLRVAGHGSVLGQPGRVEEARPDDGEGRPGEPPARVAEHHAGKRPVDHHLSEVVWIPTSREEPICDETTTGAKNEILLDVGGMMKPVADDEAGE